VSFGRDYVARTWDAATGRQLSERAFDKEEAHRFWAAGLSPDGRRIAIQHGNRLELFDVESGRGLATAKLVSYREAPAQLPPDGKQLADVEQDARHVCTLQVCDIATNPCRELGKFNDYGSPPAFSRDGKRLALATYSHGAVVWDLEGGRELGRFKPEGWMAGHVDFDPTGDVLAILGTKPNQSFQFVRISTAKPPEGWSNPEVGDFAWVRFSRDGSAILLGSSAGVVQWFDPKAGKVTRSVRVQSNGSASVPAAFSADGSLVAVAGDNALH